MESRRGERGARLVGQLHALSLRRRVPTDEGVVRSRADRQRERLVVGDRDVLSLAFAAVRVQVDPVVQSAEIGVNVHLLMRADRDAGEGFGISAVNEPSLEDGVVLGRVLQLDALLDRIGSGVGDVVLAAVQVIVNFVLYRDVSDVERDVRVVVEGIGNIFRPVLKEEAVDVVADSARGDDGHLVQIMHRDLGQLGAVVLVVVGDHVVDGNVRCSQLLQTDGVDARLSEDVALLVGESDETVTLLGEVGGEVEIAFNGVGVVALEFVVESLLVLQVHVVGDGRPLRIVRFQERAEGERGDRVAEIALGIVPTVKLVSVAGTVRHDHIAGAVIFDLVINV